VLLECSCFALLFVEVHGEGTSTVLGKRTNLFGLIACPGSAVFSLVARSTSSCGRTMWSLAPSVSATAAAADTLDLRADRLVRTGGCSGTNVSQEARGPLPVPMTVGDAAACGLWVCRVWTVDTAPDEILPSTRGVVMSAASPVRCGHARVCP
jgi:hypothetical protein